jgi:hypothetical protein
MLLFYIPDYHSMFRRKKLWVKTYKNNNWILRAIVMIHLHLFQFIKNTIENLLLCGALNLHKAFLWNAG